MIFSVLIESDWNLKTVIQNILATAFLCINRIRLEFKERQQTINFYVPANVLIESDWNLKEDPDQLELWKELY